MEREHDWWKMRKTEEAIHIRLLGDKQEHLGLPVWDLRPSFRQFTENLRKSTRFSAASEMSSVTPRMSTVVAETSIENIRCVVLRRKLYS